MSLMLSLWLSSVPPVAYRSVRQFGVPPRNSCAVRALGLEASILPWRDLNSSSVRSLVQHSAEAALVRLPEASNSAFEKGTEHFLARSVTRMVVVVCRSHWSWRQTSSPSLVKVTSHSRMPAPIRAPASWLSLVCSGNCSVPPPRWPIEKSVFLNGPSLHCSSLRLRGPGLILSTR